MEHFLKGFPKQFLNKQFLNIYVNKVWIEIESIPKELPKDQVVCVNQLVYIKFDPFQVYYSDPCDYSPGQRREEIGTVKLTLLQKR